MNVRTLLPAFAAISLFAIGCDTPTTPTDPVAAPSTQVTKTAAGARATVIPGRYIVVFEKGVELSTIRSLRNSVARAHAADDGVLYQHAVRGFAANMSEEQARQLAADPRVAHVEPDRVISIAITGKPSGGGGKGSTGETTPWGITKVGGSGDGTGKTAWIIDTGIDLDHPDLNVDVARSKSFLTNSTSPDDGNGHGTHVAGTVAAIDNTIGVVGVAANATVVAVRVLDNRGSGTYSGIIAGVDYVAATASAGDVANMSLGGPASDALDNAVRALAAKGVKVVVAAGNDGVDASNYSPARINATNVYTISATSTDDCLTSWSNYGLMIDYAAPGANILSTWRGGGTKTISGTSMAAPHVAGILLLGSVNPTATACNDRDGVADPLAKR